MIVAEQKTSSFRRSLTLADCDRHVAEWWDKFRTDPKADGEECLRKINWWLDTRLLVMKRGVVTPMED